MTDMTFEALQGHASGVGARPARKDGYGVRLAARRREYRAYFVLVVIVALPVELAAWPLRALRGGGWPTSGPLRAARSHAAFVTPIILSA